jgi:hypothetical protein
MLKQTLQYTLLLLLAQVAIVSGAEKKSASDTITAAFKETTVTPMRLYDYVSKEYTLIRNPNEVSLSQGARLVPPTSEASDVSLDLCEEGFTPIESVIKTHFSKAVTKLIQNKL